MYKVFANEIIQSSSDNTAGTLLNKSAIINIIKNLINSRNMNKDYIDNLIDKYNSITGHLVQSGDFIYVMKPYLIGE